MAKKRVTVLLTLLLSLVLILPCFVGCGNAPQEKDCPKMVTYEYNFIQGPILSFYRSLEVTLSLSPSVEFECHAIGEHYFIEGKLKDKTIKSGEILYLDVTNNEFLENVPNGYITILGKDNEHIVGYAVLVLKPLYSSDGDTLTGWNLETLKSVEFPQIDEQYQDVSEKYVQRQFKKLIKQ